MIGLNEVLAIHEILVERFGGAKQNLTVDLIQNRNEKNIPRLIAKRWQPLQKE